MYRAYSQKHAIIRQHQHEWSKYRQCCKQKRKDNIIKSLKILNDANVPYITNIDKSVTIDSNDGKVIFHPSTGTFYGAHEGRGIFNLIQKIL